ncbi:MAG TPA: citryl-CoA lyase [Anaerolineae bacterium]|nr:citryl-CoA lyase [Caldilineae bacterium]HID35405.1 citryl-CoA lyase [Anaerolineae bacterium]HIQ11992.1 citryl-CoA lyase [Caldilineales bacterium]
MTEARWRTAITDHVAHEPYLRGYRLVDLIGRYSFAEVAYLTLKGELPTPAAARMMDAMFVAVVDHGVAVPSVVADRMVISGGNPLHVGVAAGVLTFGEAHGGAIETAARILQATAAQEGDVAALARTRVAQARANKERLAGFGHRYYKERDPRTARMFEIAREVNFYGRHCALAEAMAAELKAQTGRALVLNVDGAIAAIISDMGFDWRLGKGFFIIGRVVGLVAHGFEEITRERPFRRLGAQDTAYDGPPPRALPDAEV